jgi:AmmeMemoRadiSam system protein A
MHLPYSPPLSSDDRRALLGRARQAIVQAVCSQSIADFPAPAGRLAEPGGAFVTIHCASRLRGCVGRTDRTLALAETVAQCAIGAALRDTRFRPIEPAEIDRMSIEISVLSELQLLAHDELEAGKHGLVIVRGERRGLLLPQVAAERGWSIERFLDETCGKAGLEPGAWRDPETKVLAFTAEIFSEVDFPGQEPQQEPRGGSLIAAIKKWGSG